MNIIFVAMICSWAFFLGFYKRLYSLSIDKVTSTILCAKSSKNIYLLSQAIKLSEMKQSKVVTFFI